MKKPQTETPDRSFNDMLSEYRAPIKKNVAVVTDRVTEFKYFMQFNHLFNSDTNYIRVDNGNLECAMGLELDSFIVLANNINNIGDLIYVIKTRIR